MGRCIIMKKGSGGIDPDELTATRSQVLTGYTAGVKGEDEPAAGTMPNRGIGSHAVNSGINGKGLWYYIEPGYYPGSASDGGNCWVYRTQDEIAATSGLTAAKIMKNQTVLGIAGTATSDANATNNNLLAGSSAYVNGAKINGNIPIQNPNVSGTDRITATNRSCWDGTICLGVRNGSYLNGVNWVQFSDPNFKAANFKKGVTILGLAGTFEGYVPTATDLYNNGYNQGTFQNPSRTSNTIVFESGMFTFPRKNTLPAVACTNKKWNIAGFTKINIDIDITERYSTSPAFSVISFITSDIIATNYSNLPGDEIASVSSVALGRRSISLTFTGLSYTKYLIIKFAEIGAKVYRVWLS